MRENDQDLVQLTLAPNQTRTTFEFNSDNANWSQSDDGDHNEYFLTAMVNQYDHQLRHYGRVFLNQVLRGLGIAETTYGQFAGWNLNSPAGVEVSLEKIIGDKTKVLLHFKNLQIIVMDLGD